MKKEEIMELEYLKKIGRVKKLQTYVCQYVQTGEKSCPHLSYIFEGKSIDIDLTIAYIREYIIAKSNDMPYMPYMGCITDNLRDIVIHDLEELYDFILEHAKF